MAYASKSLSSISNHSFKPQLSFTPSMASAKPSILTFLGLCYLVDLMPPDVASSLGHILYFCNFGEKWLDFLDFFHAPGKLSLVGNQAPDFEAEAVFDQEFIKFSHLAWVQTDRKSGGLGDLKYPLISDITKTISKAYDVLIADQALQCVQENPDEVCPAGWMPGDRSSHEAESEA